MAELKSAYLKLLDAAIEQNEIASEAGKLTESEEIPSTLLGTVNGHLCVGILRTEEDGSTAYHFYYSNAKPMRETKTKPVRNNSDEHASVIQTPSVVSEVVQEYPVLSFILIFLILLLLAKKMDLK